MEVVFLKLFNMSVSAGWIVLAVVILHFLIKKSPKAISCVLWIFVAIRLVCPISFESVLSLIPSTETVPQEILSSNTPKINSGIPVFNNAINPIISESLTPKTDVNANPMQEIISIISVVWVIGVVVMLIYAVISFLCLHKKVVEAVNIKNNIWMCDRVSTPFVMGLFKPRIIVPSSINDIDIEYVIAHENAHLKRHDHWWKPIGFIILSVYWFNPLMWVAYILLCRDIEFACDEKVIKEMDIKNKKLYSEALINCSVSRKNISVCPLAFGEGSVKSRIKTVLSYKKPAFWITFVAVILCAVTAICFLTNPKSVKLKGLKDEAPSYISLATEDMTFKITSHETICYAFDVMKDIRVSSSLISKKRFDDEDKTNKIVLHYKTANLSFYFDKDFTQVWCDDEVEKTLPQKVRDRKKVSELFEKLIQEKIDLDNNTYNPSYNPFIEDLTILSYNGSESYMMSTIKLSESTNSCEISFSILDGFVCSGTFKETDNELVLFCDEKNKYVFRKVDNTYVFDAKKSAAVPKKKYVRGEKPKSPIPDGAVFESKVVSNYELNKFDSITTDIDEDGRNEICYLCFGPTSGLFTFELNIFDEESKRLKYSNVFTSEFYYLSFVNGSDGKLKVRGKTQDDEPVIHIFDVSISNGSVILEENGYRVPYWK